MFGVQFQAALAAIAESKGCAAADVEAKVVAAKGPSSSGTVAEAVKFHDDKALYTVSRPAPLKNSCPKWLTPGCTAWMQRPTAFHAWPFE